MQSAITVQRWATKEDFLRCTGRGVTCTDAAVRLRRGVTLADEMGRCNPRDLEHVHGLRVAKKKFVIGSLAADRAILCPYLDCDAEDGQLEITVNGNAVVHTNERERPYWEIRWRRIEISPSWLKTGENEVLFRAVGEARWSLLIEESRHPNRSEVSEDGGKTWRSEALGDNDRADGEYLVRLWLNQYVRDGEICSEPVDLLCPGQEMGIAPFAQVMKVQLRADVSVPQGTACTLQWRAGPSPGYKPNTWMAWADVGDGIVLPAEARFFQWRALLEAHDLGHTPEVRGAALSAECTVARPVSPHVISSDNPRLMRGSYRFSYLPADASRGRRLRERWKLDDVIRQATSEFDAFLHLRQWVREQWEDGWNAGELDFCPPWDAMLILELASRKLSLGMCTHYATVMTQCCAALGLVARTLIMRSHCINEVWSNDHGKWVAMDVGGDQDDRTKFTYHFERNGVPLNALEAHRAWAEKDYDDVVIAPQPPPATGDRFAVEKRLQLFDLFMISLRNDELVTLGPGEPEHGATSYHYDNYLFWEDKDTEPLPWFSRHTDRPGDVYWTVNRAVIHLQQGENPDILNIQLETETPNLRGFEAQIDGGTWNEAGAAFTWELHPGNNRLAVRPVNAWDRRGAASSTTVRLGCI